MSRQMFIISLHLVFSGGLVIAAVLPLQPSPRPVTKESLRGGARKKENGSSLLHTGNKKRPRYHKWYPGRTWSGKRGSNPRPSAWEADALPLSYFRMSLELYYIAVICQCQICYSIGGLFVACAAQLNIPS